ncbi:MAG TPA: hypothetical protein VF980_18695 [Thermoanaerobaculia bacterium]
MIVAADVQVRVSRAHGATSSRIRRSWSRGKCPWHPDEKIV